MIRVKICGLRDEEMIESAARFGADRIGLVVVPTSPRAVGFEDAHRLAELIHRLGCEPWIVARLGTEDPQTDQQSGGQPGGGAVDKLLGLVENTPGIAAIQLHGGETPGQIAGFRARLDALATGSACRLVKGHGVAGKRDLDALAAFDAADAFLLDAKAPSGATREGGFGRSFDWSILEGFKPAKPWLLSGGLTPENVGEAIRMTGAQEVDISSGVEGAPGVKDAEKVKAFIAAAKAAGPAGS